MTMYLQSICDEGFCKWVAVVDINSHWSAFSVSDLCQLRRHKPTRNYTTVHRLTLPKVLNIIAFTPSQKHMNYETLTPVS
jgi:hypothetical protein